MDTILFSICKKNMSDITKSMFVYLVYERMFPCLICEKVLKIYPFFCGIINGSEASLIMKSHPSIMYIVTG